MNKEIGPGVIAAGIVVVLIILVFVGMKVFGKSSSGSNMDPMSNPAYAAHQKGTDAPLQRPGAGGPPPSAGQ